MMEDTSSSSSGIYWRTSPVKNGISSFKTFWPFYDHVPSVVAHPEHRYATISRDQK